MLYLIENIAKQLVIKTGTVYQPPLSMSRKFNEQKPISLLLPRSLQPIFFGPCHLRASSKPFEARFLFDIPPLSGYTLAHEKLAPQGGAPFKRAL
jgi:hypothetical protein